MGETIECAGRLQGPHHQHHSEKQGNGAAAASEAGHRLGGAKDAQQQHCRGPQQGSNAQVGPLQSCGQEHQHKDAEGKQQGA